MHLCCTHVLPWSVCARSAQHRAPAASNTGAGHKGHNPYNSYISGKNAIMHPEFSIFIFYTITLKENTSGMQNYILKDVSMVQICQYIYSHTRLKSER